MSGPGTNTGHGHVWPRPDGMVARCGGPRMCAECAKDAAIYGGEGAAGMGWQPISTAPDDGTHLLLLTGDFGVVEGWWDSSVKNFYKSQEGWASYDPENAQGDWVSFWRIGGGARDRRLYCGCTPHYWMPRPALPKDPRFT